MPPIFYLAILALGGGVGFGVGVATRPTVLGFPIPLEVLTSAHPFDQAPKQMLTEHLTTYTSSGLGIALVLVMVAYAYHAARAPSDLRPGDRREE